MIWVPWRLVICCALALTALYFLGWSLLGPGKPLRQAALRAAAGSAAVFLWNVLTAFWGAGIQISLPLLLLSAVLGLPGTVLAGVLQYILT